jgi:endonuclease YncB( thermonuclease family)
MTRRRILPPKLTGSQRRQRYAARRVGWVLAAAMVMLGLYAGDRLGLFGRLPKPVGEDYVRYNDKSFRVVHVVDGDTLDVDEPDGGKPATRIRLWGVDTPETKHPKKPVQHFGPEASDFTTRTCQGKTVRLQLVPGKTRDNYHRLLAYVLLEDGTMLNSELVRQGYGYADPRFAHPYMAKFQDLQARARRARLGLWKDLKPTDLPYYMSN